jgi:DKNYY family
MTFGKAVGTIIGLLSLLVGCGSREPYQQRNGVWHFDDQPMQLKSGEHLTPLLGAYAKTEQHGYFRGKALEGSDGRSFETLSEHYAKDHKTVYYCDAYRDGQDYFSTQRTRIKHLKADPNSFRFLKSGYARDANSVFFEGQFFPVKDINSFEILDYGFARDHVTGYYQQMPIPGSDGGSFAVLDNHYSKDRNHVYHSYDDLRQSSVILRSGRIEGAFVDSFTVLETGYAKDAKRAYHNGRALASSTAFEELSLGYAKTNRQVFYNGKPIPGAIASSFVMLEPRTDDADAKDSKAKYLAGRKVGK